MKGTGYRILDMATNNNIDLITVGGTQDYNWIPDTRDLSGDGIPSISIGNPLITIMISLIKDIIKRMEITFGLI